MDDKVQVKRALVSVTNKTGLIEFCRTLVDSFGIEIVSTGGTAQVLKDAGIAIRDIEDFTGFPEIMGGRVKTLHPKVHGGLLAKRDDAMHMNDVEAQDIELIDMVVVNLYEFEKTVADKNVQYEDAIENIDIGGPSMIRSAAKNNASVSVVTDPSDYDDILQEMQNNSGSITRETRKALATKAFKRTFEYDQAIYTWLSNNQIAADEQKTYPSVMNLSLSKKNELRYGENPHQSAAYYALPNASNVSLVNAKQIQGKELSYNNLLDADACWFAVLEFEEPACVILKHQNPCGVAEAKTIEEAYQRSFECDPTSAFGGILAINRELTKELVQQMLDNKHYVEVIIAPSACDDAVELLKEKPKIRLLITGAAKREGSSVEYRSIDGGMLIQDRDSIAEKIEDFTYATDRKPTDEELKDLIFGWKVVKSVKSNAVSLVKDLAHVGMGAGQPNRVNSARIAIAQAGDKAQGSVAASDAFFPFRDGIDALAEAGVTAIIQPGGSIRDEECIKACNEHDIAMVFTGHRHFRH